MMFLVVATAAAALLFLVASQVLVDAWSSSPSPTNLLNPHHRQLAAALHHLHYISHRHNYYYKRSSSSSSSRIQSTSSSCCCCCDDTTTTNHKLTNIDHNHNHQSHGRNHSTTTTTAKLGKCLTGLSIFFWLVSMLSQIPTTQAGLPFVGGTHYFVKGYASKLRFAGLISLVLSLPTLLPRVRRALFVKRRVDASCLMLAASVGAALLGDYPESAAVASLFSVSEVLEGRAERVSGEALSRVAEELGPGTARLLVLGDDNNNNDDLGGNATTSTWSTACSTTTVLATSVPVNSLVSVPVGEKIPCDGVVVAGTSSVDESTITGESRPVRRGIGDCVPGGAANAGPELLFVRTTALSSDSTVSRLAKLVEESRKRKSPTETLVNSIARSYAPPLFLLALAMCTIPWAFGADVGRKWMKNGLVTMVASCPCPLVISTPATYVSGLAKAAKEDIIIKGGAVLEALGKVERIFLDKTGTLTEGKFTVRNLRLFNAFEEKRTLQYLALMESPSSHPLATALVDAASVKGVAAPSSSSSSTEAANHTVIEGEGIVASINGKVVHAGNRRLFERLGLYEDLPEKEKALANEWAASGETVGFLSIEGSGIVCSYSAADGLRDGSKKAVHQLQDLGMDVCILTGDSRDTAAAIGDQVGLPTENIYSGLLPQEKLDAISKVKEETDGTILMCGDGVNDAPAIAFADVSVSLASGTALATQASDVILTNPDLTKLPFAIRLGRQARRIIRQNIVFSLAAKTCLFGLTACGIRSLWAAIASDVGTMLIVTTNALRMLPSSEES